MLTHERLIHLLDYDPKTGLFTWRSRRNWRAPAGSIAGCVNQSGYRHIIIDGVEHKAHRLALFWMEGAWPDGDVDHRNGVTDDNRYLNLRPATKSQNIANSKLRRDNKSGFKGVCLEPSTGKWMANINKDKKRHYLGLFSTPEEAHAAYVAAAKKLHGQFARSK